MGILHKINYLFNKKEKTKMLIIFICMLIGAFFELLGVSIILPFITLIMSPNEVISSSWYMTLDSWFGFNSINVFMLYSVLLLSIIYVIKNSFLLFLCYIQNRYVYGNRIILSHRLMKCYLDKTYTYHLQKNSAEIIRTVTNDVNQLVHLIKNILLLCTEVLVVIFLGVYLFLTEWVICLTVILMLVTSLLSFRMLIKTYTIKCARNNQFFHGKIIQFAQQALGGLKEIKILKRESLFLKEFNVASTGYSKSIEKQQTISQIPRFFIETVCVCGILIVVCIKSYNGANMSELVPQLSVFAIAAFRLLPSANRINQYINEILFFSPSIDIIYHELKEIEVINESFSDGHDYEINLRENDIEVQNVSFVYPGSNEYILNNVSFSILRGKSTAFIGTSGAGKTTIVDILLGLLVPSQGEIIVGNINVHQNLKSWSKKIGYIPQSIYLCDDTLKKNVAFGISEEDIKLEKVELALRQAQLEEFVDTLEYGIETMIGEQGIRLSGGQRQRIGIARALYDEPELLVLDEATSALDNETEMAVMEAINNLHGKITIVIIAHRIATTQNCDVIYEVKNKQIDRINEKQFKKRIIRHEKSNVNI